MDRCILTENDVTFLMEWRDEHKNEVRSFPMPMKSILIEVSDIQLNLKCIREDDIVKIGLNFEKLPIGNVRFKLLPTLGAYQIITRPTEKSSKIFKKSFGGKKVLQQNFLETMLTGEGIKSIGAIYFALMALMVYGPHSMPVTEPKERKEPAQKRSTSQKAQKGTQKTSSTSVTYILHRKGNTACVVSQGKRGPILKEFSVRGHFRHYKSGKVVWVNEYKKGTGKKAKKLYKIGEKDYESQRNLGERHE